ncbi:MAG: hypothetical protein ACI4KD_08525 [Oscillospiraceae bacterium]
MVKLKRKQKGASGSALFMVICIMAILMVVAVTAMAMVSIAYTRSLQNYTASQSYVTAKNTLDMIVEVTDNVTTTNDYGQVGMGMNDRAAIAQPLFDVITLCNTDVYSSGTYDNSKAGGQVAYGTVTLDTTDLNGISFVDYTKPDGTVLGQIKYEVLPDPNAPSSISEVTRNDIDGFTGDTTKVKYGSQETADLGTVGDKDRIGIYSYARVKMTVKVQSGSGDTAQIRTVSRIYDAKLFELKEKDAPTSESHANSGPGRFTQAVKTMGKYTSGTGMNVIGGISAKGGGGSFAGLKGNTSSVYINGNFNPKDSGHNGTMDIGAGQQITINGKFTVDNNFNFNSTYNPATDTGSKPFIYCDEIEWRNSNIPSGDMDIITKNGGVFGRDSNKITGNVLSGGNLELVGNNLEITGNIIVDGNVNIAQSIKGTGTIYYTGSINKSEAEANGVKFVKLPAGTVFDVKNPAVDSKTGVKIVTTPITPSTTYNISTDQSVFGEYHEDGDVSKGVVPAETPPASVDVTVDDTTNGTGPSSKNIIYVDIPEGTTQTVYLQPGNYQDVEIVIRGGGDATFYQDGDVNMSGVRVWSELVKNKVESGEEIDMKTLADDPDYSQILWYVDSGASLNISSSGSDGNLLNAYIYGPEAGIMYTSGGDASGPYVKVKDEFGNVSNMKTWLMGAVVGNEIKMCDGSSGIIFINPEGTGSGGSGGSGGSSTPGGTTFDRTSVRYNLKAPGVKYYTNR